jgi:oligosaccharide translocation protein RFT1
MRLKQIVDGKQNVAGTINLVWLSLPIAAACSLVLGYVWIHALEPPRPELADQYAGAVKLYCAGSLTMLLAEPFYIVGQAHLLVELKSLSELANAVLGVVVMVAAVMLQPDRVVLLAGYGSVACSCVFLAIHLAYFSWVMKRGAEKDDEFPFTSLLDFLPDVRNFRVNAHQRSLSLSFFKQGFLKQLLTEGERYMFTWFSLLTLAEQGVYDVIASLGSIPARLVFAKLEESAHLYFSQTVMRGADPAQVRDREADASRHLHLLLKVGSGCFRPELLLLLLLSSSLQGKEVLPGIEDPTADPVVVVVVVVVVTGEGGAPGY